MTMILVGHIVETDFFYQTRLKNCWKNAKYRVTGCRHDPLCQSGIMLQVNPVTPAHLRSKAGSTAAGLNRPVRSYPTRSEQNNIIGENTCRALPWLNSGS
jgi:hypothetical protein